MSSDRYPYPPYYPQAQYLGRGGELPPTGYPMVGGGMGGAMGAQMGSGHYGAYPPPLGAAGPGVYAAAQPSAFARLASDRFLKGVLIGAAATYLLTNEGVQRTLIKSAVKAWNLVQGGVEEIKERFHDAEAELHNE